jgi:hypothetical protein
LGTTRHEGSLATQIQQRSNIFQARFPRRIDPRAGQI